MKKAVFLVLGPALVMLLSGGLPGCASASGRQSEAQAYYDQGNQYLNQKNYDQAIETFNAALKINPKFVDAYFNRGNAYRNKGDNDRAIADYSAVIKINPNLANAYINRGNAYSNKGDHDRAIADYSEAIKINPNDALAYNNRGLAYQSKREYDRAIADYSEAIKIKPDYSGAYINRGVAYRNKGDNDRAIADYSEAIKIKPNYSDAYNNRGFAYKAKGDNDRALADYDAALKIDPNHARAKNNRDALLAQMNREAEEKAKDAQKAAEREAQFNPNKLNRSQYKEITVEDFSFDMVAGTLAAGTKVAFNAKFLAKPTGPTYQFHDIDWKITLSTTHNFVRDMPDWCFGSAETWIGWMPQIAVKVFVTVKKPGQAGECSVDIVEW